MNNYIKELIEFEYPRIKLLNSLPELDNEWINNYLKENYSKSLNEMSRINVKEFAGYFPANKFDIKIWSNDHNPPHFHVLAGGWNIIVNIENGKIIKTKSIGKDSKIYSYVEKYINDWLDSKSVVNKNKTNRETARMIWQMNNNE